jgi:hypothetical protein
VFSDLTAGYLPISNREFLLVIQFCTELASTLEPGLDHIGTYSDQRLRALVVQSCKYTQVTCRMDLYGDRKGVDFHIE